MKAMLLAGALAAMAGTANANLTGNQLHGACGSDEMTMQGFCTGYVIGVVEGIRYGFAYPHMAAGESTADEINSISDAILMNCPPQDVQNGQYVDLTKNYLSAFPEQRHQPARGLILFAIQAAFPCS